MSPNKWQEISKIFNSALEKDKNHRESFLSEACGEDEQLRSEIELLINAHENIDSFIDSPEIGLIKDSPTLDLKKGDKLESFEIDKLIGKGGMGEVYLAQDKRLNRSVALKVLPPELATNPNANKRLLREAQSAASLEHPNICTIHEIVETEDYSFIVMQFVEGETLADVLKKEPLSIRNSLKVAIQIAEAISDAHKHGIIHRDIKPANIILSNQKQVKVLDFGLAKKNEDGNLESGSIKSLISHSGLILGTASYMSPEQARGLSVDFRTDLWSLGVVLYEMVVGEKPFKGDSLADKFVSILHKEPVFPAEVNTKLKEIILNLLQKDAAKRYQNADDLISDLKKVRQEVDFEKQLIKHNSADSDESILNAKFLNTSEIDSKSKELIAKNKPKSFFQKVSLLQIGLVMLFLSLIGFGGWYLRQVSNTNWANENIRRIAELAQEERNFEAYDLAKEVQTYLPKDDEKLAKLMPVISDKISVVTEPVNSKVFLKRYMPDERGFFPKEILIGVTPIKDFEIARGHYILRVEKEGFASFERTISGTIPRIGGSFIDSPPIKIEAKLIESGKVPQNMVFIPNGEYWLVNWSRPAEEKVKLGDYFIDKYEVSNKDFKEFVTKGGYRTREFWRYPFIKGGKEIPLEEAVVNFKDKTGLPAPRNWSNQDFPEGEGDLPVTGITWYEASAYANFRGKELPTVYQWDKAARNGLTDPRYNAMPWGLIKQGENIDFRANFSSDGKVSVNEYEFGMSPFGAFNMAGNVSEWILNRSGDNYVTSGGAWDDLPYTFGGYGKYPGFYASEKLGFRCVLNLSNSKSDQGSKDLLPDEIPEYETSSESDLKTWMAHYQYDKKTLKTEKIEVKEEEDWTQEKITFVEQDNQQIIAYLYLPKNYEKPLQVIHYVPPGDVVRGFRSLPDSVEMFLKPILKSGRAVFTVVLKGYNERPFPNKYVPPERNTVAFRKQAVNWITDLRRGIDYLETRKEVDFKTLSFLGISNGANLGILTLGIEKRYDSAILVGAGVDKKWQSWIPAANFINFAPHSELPKLIINGRYDETHPLNTYSEPLYKILSEPKRQVIYDGGHIPTVEFFSKSVNSWLDEQIKPPRRF